MTIEDYILSHSDAEPEYLRKINRKTHVRLMNPRMVSGHFQGRFLALFCEITGAKIILELGTFTGYSALCLAENLPEDGVVHSIEKNDELEDFINENLNSVEHGKKVVLHIGEALDEINKLDLVFDLVFIDADKREYTAYYEAVLPKLKVGGIILADNTLWNGKVMRETASNDWQTIEIIQFNEHVAADKRVERLILPFRDGLTLIRKK